MTPYFKAGDVLRHHSSGEVLIVLAYKEGEHYYVNIVRDCFGPFHDEYQNVPLRLDPHKWFPVTDLEKELL